MSELPIHKQVEAAVQKMNDQAAQDRADAARHAGPSAAFGAGGSLFEVDGMVVCGALLGGIYIGMVVGNVYGILGGAAGGAALGAAFAYAMRAAGWAIGGVFRAPRAIWRKLREPHAQPAPPFPARTAAPPIPAQTIRRSQTAEAAEPKGRGLLKWTLGGAILGALAGVAVAYLVDAADAMAMGALRVGMIGAALGFTLRLLTLPFRRRA